MAETSVRTFRVHSMNLLITVRYLPARDHTKVDMRLSRWNLLMTVMLGTVALGVVLCLCAPAIGQSQPAQSKPAQDDMTNSLPSTNLSTDSPVDRHVPAPAPGFANATVADNPL